MKTIKYDKTTHDHYSMYQALKAAKTLLMFAESQVDSGQVIMKNIAIDFDSGVTLEFTPKDYYQFARKGLEHALNCASDNPENFNPLSKIN